MYERGIKKLSIRKDSFLFAAIYLAAVLFSGLFIDELRQKTYFFYVFVMSVSLFLAFLDEAVEKENKGHTLFWLAMILAGAVMACRAQTGLDDSGYKESYLLAGHYSFFDYLESSPMEKGYLAFTYFLYQIFGTNYNLAQMCITYFSFFFWGKAFLHHQAWGRKSSMLVLLWTHYYFIFMNAGLVRIYIAIPIVLDGLAYLFERKRKYFCFSVLFAALFHVSSLIMLGLLVFEVEGGWLKKNWKLGLILVAAALPAIFLLIGTFAGPILGAKYRNYVIKGLPQFSINNFDVLPVFLMGAYLLPSIEHKQKKIYSMGLVLCFLSVIVSVNNSVVSLGRLNFYTNLGIIIIFSHIMKVPKPGKKMLIVQCVLLVYAIVYFVYTGMIATRTIFPYKAFWGWTV